MAGKGGTKKESLPLGLIPRLLSRDQAAAYCGISTSHFTQTVAKAVQSIKLGDRVLWDRRVIDRWLDQQLGLSNGVDLLGSIEELLDGDAGEGR